MAAHSISATEPSIRSMGAQEQKVWLPTNKQYDCLKSKKYDSPRYKKWLLQV